MIVLKYILKVLGMYFLSTFPQKGMYLYLSTFVVESEKNARCRHTRETKKRAAKPKMERRV